MATTINQLSTYTGFFKANLKSSCSGSSIRSVKEGQGHIHLGQGHMHIFENLTHPHKSKPFYYVDLYLQQYYSFMALTDIVLKILT